MQPSPREWTRLYLLFMTSTGQPGNTERKLLHLLAVLDRRMRTHMELVGLPRPGVQIVCSCAPAPVVVMSARHAPREAVIGSAWQAM
jgi:hypothetical protein